MTPSVQVLYRQDDYPIFQNRMYASAAEAAACPKGDIMLVEDERSGLVYNAAFRSELMVYDAEYQNEQGVSPLFRRHLDDVADMITRCLGRERLVEVGCGKGLFLELLLAAGVDILGYDPTYEGDNPNIVREYVRRGLNLNAKGFVMRHVLEHIEKPYEFLTLLRDANGGGGLIYIEVPCFDWICRHRAWFDIFYEHVNYFRASDFRRMFGRVIEAGHSFGGQYQYVVADLASLRPPQIDQNDRVTFPRDFTRTLDVAPVSSKMAIWGGASKGVIFALLRSRRQQTVDAVIDINPAKQGKYLPATGLLVKAPKEGLARLPAGSSIYVMNSNYLEEIKTMSGDAYNYVVIDHD
jgi:hypothetical protein